MNGWMDAQLVRKIRNVGQEKQMKSGEKGEGEMNDKGEADEEKR